MDELIQPDSDTSLAGYFRGSDSAKESVLAWRIDPYGDLPDALVDLSDLLAAWHASEPGPRHAVGGLLGTIPQIAAFAEVAYKAQLLPMLGDAQACQRPGATGDLAAQPWRVEWSADFLTLDRPIPAEAADKNA